MPADWLLRSSLTARQLALLVHLAEQGSVLRAADAVHMTQPAASRVLHTIERSLGVALFTRHPRGVEPTLFGHALVRHARAALAEFRQAHDELKSLASGITGEVRIGTTVTSATDLVPMAVQSLTAVHPRVRIRIELGFSEELVTHVLERRLDIAIARLHPHDDLRGVAFEALGEEPHGVIVRSGHPLARRRSLALSDLAGQTWVLPPPGNVMRDALTVLFLQQGIEFPRQVVETSALPIITSLLRLDDFVAVLPVEVVRPYYATRVLAPLRVPLDLRLGAAGIVTRRGVELSPAASALIDSLRSTAGTLYPRQST